MANSVQVDINVGGLTSAIQNMDRQFKRVIAGQFMFAKPESVAYAKAKAPWTDRTGNARAGLHADVRISGQGTIYELLLAHSVFYGVFLETRFSGRYAILMPTLDHIGRLIMQRTADSMSKLELKP